ncbi:hypothetical protein ACFQ5N_06735 [Lutibacter holmesii]|uniref:Uncharacterized protein n=1 Tax=Lutibacter holmesii TaxID=1137985 RepID=A0ABW3WQF7_9FLAO
MKKLILVIALFIGVTNINAQRIYGIKHTVEANEYGNWSLIVTPNQFHAHEPKTTEIEGIYAILVCFTVKGKQTQKYIDCTKDFVEEGEKRVYLASSYKKRNEINIKKVTFFRRDEPRENWPKKDCY